MEPITAKENLKILHIITGLNLGGAETMLYKLLKSSPKTDAHVVISLSGKGFYYDKIQALGVSVYCLSAKKNPFALFFRLHKIIKKENPHAIQCWMYHSNLIGAFAGYFAKVKNVCFGIRHTISKNDKFLTRVIDKISAWLSKKFCKAVICCGKNPLEASIKSGYAKDKLHVIYNGFDTSDLKFSSEGRCKIRSEFGFDEHDFVITHIARFHHLKNHVGLLRIFAKVLQKNKNAKLLLVGDGIVGNPQVENQLDALQLRNSVVMAGLRRDVVDIYSASDVSVLPSLSEGFPNVVGEAMLCECPCVVSDVGDSAMIVGNDAYVADVVDEIAFAEKILAISNMNDDEKTSLKDFCRNRILENFNINKIYQQYKCFWQK